MVSKSRSIISLVSTRLWKWLKANILSLLVVSMPTPIRWKRWSRKSIRQSKVKKTPYAKSRTAMEGRPPLASETNQRLSIWRKWSIKQHMIQKSHKSIHLAGPHLIRKLALKRQAPFQKAQTASLAVIIQVRLASSPATQPVRTSTIQLSPLWTTNTSTTATLMKVQHSKLQLRTTVICCKPLRIQKSPTTASTNTSMAQSKPTHIDTTHVPQRKYILWQTHAMILCLAWA